MACFIYHYIYINHAQLRMADSVCTTPYAQLSMADSVWQTPYDPTSYAQLRMIQKHTFIQLKY